MDIYKCQFSSYPLKYLRYCHHFIPINRTYEYILLHLHFKYRQLQEARQRLAFIQQNTQLLTPSTDKNEQAIVSSARETESESESESVSTAEDLSWQEDPEFQAKVR